MSDYDLTKLSKKELESKLAKKYGVDKYLNQRSQLLELMNIKGETDIDSGFTGPETEALSIMFENKPVIGSRSKSEGGIVSLFGGSIGGDDGDDEDAQDYSDSEAQSSMSGDFTGGAGDDGSDNDESNEVSERGDVFGAGPTQYGKDFTKQQKDSYSKQVTQNPQLQGFLGKEIKKRIGEGDFELERNKDGLITGVYSQAEMPGALGAIARMVGSPIEGKVYTGYGQGYQDMFNQDDGDDSSEMIKKIVKEKEEKKKDSPLSQEQIDYYTRGMGTATKSLKTLEDINSHMSSLVGPTESSTGAKLSKDKKFLILANGKIINTTTGRVQDSMSGLELFRGGLV
jgi:hypothetical protein